MVRWAWKAVREILFRVGALAELFKVARTHPQRYVTQEGMDARAAVELAERSAVSAPRLLGSCDGDNASATSAGRGQPA
ncbi:MAG: hypothetical protein LH624_01625 [Cryobacterium sp.]|nr:hypothetical protein [Cryobacterium sp.]